MLCKKLFVFSCCMLGLWMEYVWLHSRRSDSFEIQWIGSLLVRASAISPTEIIIQVDLWMVVLKMFPYFCTSIDWKLKLKPPMRFVISDVFWACSFTFFASFFLEKKTRLVLVFFFFKLKQKITNQEQLHQPTANHWLFSTPFKRDKLSQTKRHLHNIQSAEEAHLSAAQRRGCLVSAAASLV